MIPSTTSYWSIRLWVLPILPIVALLLLFPTGVHAQSIESLLEQGQTAGADAELMETVVSRAKQRGLSSQETANLLHPAVSLAEKDLPADPLLSKTLEGLAKRVPAARMSPVLKDLQSATERGGALVSSWLNRESVQSSLNQTPSTTERNQLIANVTEAQQQNVPFENLEAFLNSLPEAVQRRPMSVSEVSVAVSVLPDLPGAQSNPKLSQQLLTAAMNAGYDEESLRQLPSALESARRASQQPATVIAQGTAQAIAQGTPAENVLRNLFQGSIPGVGPPSNVGNGPSGSIPGQGKPPGKGGRPPVDPGVQPPVGDKPPNDNPGGGGGY